MVAARRKIRRITPVLSTTPSPGLGAATLGDPNLIAEELARDAAVQAADTVLLTVPNQLGVDFNLRMLESIVKDIKPALTVKA